MTLAGRKGAENGPENGAGITGVILAGGDSLRMDGGRTPKALAQLAGAPLVLHVAAGLARQGASRIVILAGRNHDTLRSGLGLPTSGQARATLQISRADGTGTALPIELRASGDSAGTGGRLLALELAEIAPHALLSYTDILADAAPGALACLCAQGAELAVLAVLPRLPWGVLRLGPGDSVIGFDEKPPETRWINGGVMAITPAVLAQVRGSAEMLEDAVMARMLARGRVRALRHGGHWAALDTPKDIAAAEADIAAGHAPWRHWTGLRLIAAPKTMTAP